MGEDYSQRWSGPPFRQRFHNHTQSKVDKNQPEIVIALRRLGWYVMHTHAVKKACDLMVLKKGRVVAIEIKDGAKVASKRKLTRGEKDFKLLWELAGGEWALIESVEDVLTL